MSRFKRCASCGIVVTKIKRSRFDNNNNNKNNSGSGSGSTGWDAIRWQRPNNPGDPDRFVGQCNDGSTLKEINPVFIICKTCVECYNLLNLEVDFENKKWIIPEDIEKMILAKTLRSRIGATITATQEERRGRG